LFHIPNKQLPLACFYVDDSCSLLYNHVLPLPMCPSLSPTLVYYIFITPKNTLRCLPLNKCLVPLSYPLQSVSPHSQHWHIARTAMDPQTTSLPATVVADTHLSDAEGHQHRCEAYLRAVRQQGTCKSRPKSSSSLFPARSPSSNTSHKAVATPAKPLRRPTEELPHSDKQGAPRTRQLLCLN